ALKHQVGPDFLIPKESGIEPGGVFLELAALHFRLRLNGEDGGDDRAILLVNHPLHHELRAAPAVRCIGADLTDILRLNDDAPSRVEAIFDAEAIEVFVGAIQQAGSYELRFKKQAERQLAGRQLRASRAGQLQSRSVTELMVITEPHVTLHQ